MNPENAPEKAPATTLAPKPRKKRRWLRRLLVAFLAVVVAVVAFEIYLRCTMGRLLGPAFDLRMYEVDESGWPQTMAGYDGEITVSGRTTSVHLNGLGLRGDAVGERQPGEKRILAVGDSQAFGMGVEYDETFAHQLQLLLAEDSDAPVTVRIGAAPGYGTFDSAKVVERVRDRFDPDLVVAAVYIGNDLEDNFQVSKTAVNGYYVFGPPARMKEGLVRMRLATEFRVWFLVEDFIGKHIPSWAIPVPDPGPEIEAFRDFPVKRERMLFMDAVETTPGIARILDRLEEGLRAVETAAGSAPVLVLLIPSPPHCYDDLYALALRQQDRKPEDYERGKLQRMIAARCQRLGLDVVDATATLAALPEFREGFIVNDDHLSPRGHAAVARLIADHLVEKGR